MVPQHPRQSARLLEQAAHRAHPTAPRASQAAIEQSRAEIERALAQLVQPQESSAQRNADAVAKPTLPNLQAKRLCSELTSRHRAFEEALRPFHTAMEDCIRGVEVENQDAALQMERACKREHDKLVRAHRALGTSLEELLLFAQKRSRQLAKQPPTEAAVAKAGQA